MSFQTKALLAALLVTAAAPVPAFAAGQQQQGAAAAGQPQQRQLAPSNEARAAVMALKKAADENRLADFPALSQAVLAVAKTPVDRYFAYQLQLRPAAVAKNNPMIMAALDGMIASGVPQGAELARLLLTNAELNFEAGNNDRGIALIEQRIAIEPTNADQFILLGEARNRQGRFADAVTALQRAVALRQQAGQPVDPRLTDRVFAIAFNNRLPIATEIALSNLKAQPTSANWRRAIRTAERASGVQGPDRVDFYRLQRLTSSLEGEQDHYVYVDMLLARGLPGEAKQVLEEAFAANRLNRTADPFKTQFEQASGRIAADRATLAASERTALAGGTARAALNNGDALLSYGEFARAAALYRAALGRPGVDSSVANLRLGAALAQAGDKAGATAALNAVTGPRQGIAQLWLLWLQSRG